MMDWAEYMILVSFLFLVQFRYVHAVAKDVNGANSATLAEMKNNRDALRAVNITKDAIKTKDSKVSMHNPVSDLTDQAVLRDNAPEDFEESKFEEDPLSPSGVEENLYGQLEDQQAKMSGFQLEKESSGNNIYIGPVAQMKDSRNDSTVRQSEDQKSSNAGVPKKVKPAVKEDVFSNATTVEQKVLNDPLTKVSYLLNREANSRRNPPLESLDNKATQTKDHRISITQYSMKIPTEVIATNAANYVPDRTRKVVAMPLPNSTDDKRIPLNSISDDNEPNLNKSESGQKHRSLPSPGRVANSQQEAVNVQLAELVQGVINRLGNEGTKFVSLELAKHPVVKNIWANVIAQALIKQSEKLSQLDTRTNSNDSPTVSSPEADLIPTSRNEATNNLPKMKVTADFKTKTSNGMVLTKVNQPKNKVKIGNKTLNAAVHEISQKHDLNSSTSAMTLLGMSKPTVATSEDKPRVQSVAKEKPISQIGHTDKFPITHIPNFQDNSSVKPGTQIENTNKTINKKARSDGGIHINHTHYSIPLTDTKYFNRHGSNHPIEETKQQDLGSNPISNTTVNRIADNKNINNFEGGTQEGQREGVMTQIGYNFDSSNESSASMGESNDLKEQYLGDKPTVENSEFSPNQRTDSSFLYNTTKLDPAETNYIQMNLMGDPVMNEEFSESGGPYASQQQLKEADEEAKYLEQKVNDAGQIVQELLPGLNANFPKEDSEEVRYLSDQLQDNYPYTQAQLAESFSHENDLLHAENEQNAQILSSVLKEDKNIATITNQLRNNQYQGRTDSAGTHTANYTGEKLGAISRSTTLRHSNQPRNKDGTTMEIESRGPMILGPRTISDISTVDLAPMRNLQGFHSSYNMNKPESSFINEIQREGSDNTESLISGGNVARFMTQQQSIPSQDTDSQAQKKRQIHTLKHTKIKSLKIRAKSSNSSSIVPVFQRRSKHAKKLSNKASLAIKPTKSHNQPAVRESEISPTSVIFGLTTNDMKELEKHLTHESNTSDGGQQAGMKREEKNKKLANISLAYLMGTILPQKEFETIRGPSTKHRNIHKALHNRKYIKPSSTSPDIPFVDRKHKKRKHKRDLVSWEANTNVLNDDLDQIRDLSPKAQENLSKAIMKDYDRQLRNIKVLLNSADDVTGMKRRVLVPRLWSPKDMHTRETTQRKREVEVATEFNDGTFRSPDFEKQLSRALMKESEHDLTYLGALRDVDNHGLKTLVNEADGPSSSRTISKNMFTNPLQNDNKIGTPDNANSESIKKKQEKLRLFLQNSNHSGEGDDHWQVGEKKEWTTPGMKDSIFRDFTPESNVVSSYDKEAGSLGTDAQTQLASVLRSVHDGDQRDLNELQKMYRDDEKDVESLFTPFAGKFKRSRRKRSAFLKEGAIETIADIPDPGTEEKNLNFVVNSGMKSETNLMWSAWSKCSKSCGSGSMKTRSRYCNQSSPSDTFVRCPGWNHQSVPCDVPKQCPINGAFTTWTEWSACSETCGPNAVRMRMRFCTQPSPAYGGKDCSGDRFQVVYCRSKECPPTAGGQAKESKQVPPNAKALQGNKQIILKTLSSTPLIEELTTRLPNKATESSSSERTLFRYSGLANLRPEMEDMPLAQSLLNRQRNLLQVLSRSPRVHGFQQMPDVQQFAGISLGSNLLTGSSQDQRIASSQSLASTPFMNSFPQREQETYENGGRGIHIQGDNDIGFTSWSGWTRCSNSCGRGIQTRTRSCISNLNSEGIDRTCLGPKVQTRRCRIRRCPVDGQFTPWSDWSECSKTCGSDSYRQRERTCTDPPPRYGGEDCDGRSVEKRHCLRPPCPPTMNVYNDSTINVSTNSTDGFTEWGPWSHCSRTCGSNLLRVRKRSCYNQSSLNCRGSTSEVKPCALPKCPEHDLDFSKLQRTGVNATSSHNISVKNEFDWSPWSACSKTCGVGSYRTREKACSLMLSDNESWKVCVGSEVQKVPCSVPLCPRQASGKPDNILQIGQPEGEDEDHLPSSKSTAVSAQLTSYNSSTAQNPIHVSSNSNYSDWSVWSECSATCGHKAVMSRKRTCKVKTGCQGINRQTKPCKFVECPVDGGLTGWTAWSACTKTCHTNAVSIRERYCTNPPPQGKGKECVGQRMEARACASTMCQAVGGVSKWSAWSVCRRCGKGTRKRTRKCNEQPPAYGGKSCMEPLVQREGCPAKHCKSTLGFGSWSSFSSCSHSCNGGIKRRRRRCRHPSLGCNGPRVQRKACNSHKCPDENYLVREDPVELCGYHPCKVAKCVTSRKALCVSDLKCQPVFFNRYGRIINSCRGDSILLSVPPEQVCPFNPCKNSVCFTGEAERCVVSYKCKPIFIGADGQRLYCRGILTIPARTACGFDPCFEKACDVDFTARCVADTDCKPTFISKTQRVLDECIEYNNNVNANGEDEDDVKKSDNYDVEELSDRDGNDGEDEEDDNDNDDDDDDDDDEDGTHKRKHKKHKTHKKSHDDDADDDDDDSAVSKHIVPSKNDRTVNHDGDYDNTRRMVKAHVRMRTGTKYDTKKDVTPVVKSSDKLF